MQKYIYRVRTFAPSSIALECLEAVLSGTFWYDAVSVQLQKTYSM